MSDAMTKELTPSCPPAQTLARFAAGRLDREEMNAVVAHLDGCRDCMQAIETAVELLDAEEETGARGRRWWMAAVAAGVVVAVLAVVATRERLDLFGGRAGTRQLMGLTRDDRVVEPRLSGFRWAPYRGPVRSAQGDGDVTRMKIGGAAADAAERAQRDPSPAARQTAGVAMLLAQRPEDSVTLLRQATEGAPDDAGAWSDLAAAQLVAAAQLGQPSRLADALAAADRALRLEPSSSEALFNRALILERLGLRDAAQAAWQRYLQTDSSSPWAGEAQSHRKSGGAADIEQRYRRDLPRIESAAAAGDLATVQRLVAAYPQQCRTFAEALHLGQWGEAEQRGDRAAAARLLTLSRAVGAALAESSHEMLLRDAVAAIDAASADGRAGLAAAHAAYYHGRMLYARQKTTEAEALLREAAAGFARNGSPMALLARYYAANAAFDRQQTAAANAELTALLREAAAHPDYAALGAQIRWELALCAMFDGAWSEALPLLREAEAIFTRQHESGNAANIDSLLATTLMASGRTDEGWESRIRAFDTLGRDGAHDRLLVAVGAAVRVELRSRRLASARALLQIEEAMCRQEGNPAMTADALLRDAMLNEQLGDRAAAESLMRAAAAETSAISDVPLRRHVEADVAFARGAVVLASDPAQARRDLSQAIDAYASVQHAVFLPEAYLLRARAASASGDGRTAAADLERGVAELERHPIPLTGGLVGTGLLDAGHRLYEEAVRIQLARGDVEAAFAYAERARGARSDGSAALRERLAGTGAAVLDLMTAGDELVAFAVTENGLSVTRSPIDAARLPSLSNEDLYDALLRPSSAVLGRARSLIVVASDALRNVAFSALVDRNTGQRLIQRFPVVCAPSAASLHAAALPPRPRSVLAVALPSGGDASVALPDSGIEIAEVARAYASSRVLEPEQATVGSFTDAAAHADVIHIAGHTERQAGAGDAAFVFAGGERMSAERLSSMPMAAGGVVVLAGCNTLRNTARSSDRAATLGEAFLAAGARAVVGTLTPIADRDARELFAAFHRQLASGIGEAEALRHVQLDAIAAGRSDGWSSLALLTNRVPPSR